MAVTKVLSDALWALLGAVTVGLVIFSALAPDRLARLSLFVRAIRSRPGLQVVVVLGWMWVGWHFFAR